MKGCVYILSSKILQPEHPECKNYIDIIFLFYFVPSKHKRMLALCMMQPNHSEINQEYFLALALTVIGIEYSFLTLGQEFCFAILLFVSLFRFCRF